MYLTEPSKQLFLLLLFQKVLVLSQTNLNYLCPFLFILRPWTEGVPVCMRGPVNLFIL